MKLTPIFTTTSVKIVKQKPGVCRISWSDTYYATPVFVTGEEASNAK